MLKDYDLKQLVSPIIAMVFKSCPCIAMARGTDSIPGVGFGDHAPADESGGGKAVF